MEKKLGEKIATLRKEKNITQDKLAQLIKVHGRHLGRIEQGKSNPSAEVIKKIAEVLNVTTDFLLLDNTKELEAVKVADKELLRSIEEVDKLDIEDRAVIKRLIQAFVKEKKIKDLASI